MTDAAHPGRRPAFAGGDQGYLRDVQYRTGVRLDARAHLHRAYSTAATTLPTFCAALIDWAAVTDVLEVGCGTGLFWLNGVSPSSVDLTLTDLSPGMVDEACERARGAGFGAVSGRTCDVQSLPFDGERFDLVLANHMLYHVPDPDLAISELARVMRADGVVLAATNGRGHMREIDEVIAETFGDHGEELAEVFGIDTGEARLRERFASVVWHAYDNDLIVDDVDAVVAYGLSFPPGDAATPDEQAAFAAAVARRFVDGRLRIRTRAGVFVCRSPR